MWTTSLLILKDISKSSYPQALCWHFIPSLHLPSWPAALTAVGLTVCPMDFCSLGAYPAAYLAYKSCTALHNSTPFWEEQRLKGSHKACPTSSSEKLESKSQVRYNTGNGKASFQGTQGLTTKHFFLICFWHRHLRLIDQGSLKFHRWNVKAPDQGILNFKYKA